MKKYILLLAISLSGFLSLNANAQVMETQHIVGKKIDVNEQHHNNRGKKRHRNNSGFYELVELKRINSELSHVCHMDTVYLRVQNRMNYTVSLSMVWNTYSLSALLCEEYEDYIDNMEHQRNW